MVSISFSGSVRFTGFKISFNWFSESSFSLNTISLTVLPVLSESLAISADFYSQYKGKGQ